MRFMQARKGQYHIVRPSFCTLTELKVVVPVMVHYDHDAKWEPRESIP